MIHKVRSDIDKKFAIHLLQTLVLFIKRNLTFIGTLILSILLIILLNRQDCKNIIKDSLANEFIKVDIVYNDIINKTKKIVGFLLDELYSSYHGVDISTMLSEFHKNIALKEQNIILTDENIRLKESLNYVAKVNYDFVTTTVAFTKSGPLGQMMLLNIGSRDGLKVGSPLLKNGFLVGKVVEVDHDFSTAVSIYNVNVKVAASLIPSHKSVIISGLDNIHDNDFDHKLKILYSSKEEWSKDELLVTEGDGELMPLGIPIATIENNVIHSPITCCQGGDKIQVVITGNKSN